MSIPHFRPTNPLAEPVEPVKAFPLPWSATIAALIALGAVWIAAPQLFLVPLLAVALVASHLTSARIPNRSILYWTIRLALIALSLLSSVNESASSDTFGNERAANLLGLLCASELIFQVWRERSEWGSFVPLIAMLSGFVFLRGCNTFETRNIRIIAPLYSFFLILSLRSYRPRPLSSRPIGRVVAILAAMLFGLITQQIFWLYHNQITAISDRMIFGQRIFDGSGMSDQPRLGSTFLQRGSTQRVLRLEQYQGPEHLRGATFIGYDGRSWSPPVFQRSYTSIVKESIEPSAASIAADRTESRFVPLRPSYLLFAPLETTAIDAGENDSVEWVRAEHAPIRGGRGRQMVHSFYTVILPGKKSRFRALFDMPQKPNEEYLNLPLSFGKGKPVRNLADQIVAEAKTPTQRVDAVVAWLLRNKSYSLHIQVQGDDPVVDFLLNHKAAHCEFFAASAVLLLRCAGVPSRYVTGYYAHESDGKGNVIVRQRDAHAWAEAWIAGKGWTTVDATPGDGRPDHDTGGISAWQRFAEWAEDTFDDLREKISKLNTDRPALIVIVISAIILAGLMVRYLYRRNLENSQEFAYTFSDAELARITRRFETLLRNRNITLQNGQTWEESIAVLRDTFGDSVERFIALYNRLRFGQNPGTGEFAESTTLGELREMLTQFERKNNARPPAA